MKWFKRQLLKSRLQRAIRMRYFQPGYEKKPDGSNKYFCNVFARDFLDSRYCSVSYTGGRLSWYNYNIQFIRPNCHIRDIILNTPIEEAYDNLLRISAGGHIKLLSCALAMIAAWHGDPVHVISSKHNHEAIVYPMNKIYVVSSDLYVAQAGKHPGIFPIDHPYSFNTIAQDPDVTYILYPKWGD